MPFVLTDRFCSSVRSDSKRSEFFDDVVSGLSLRVTKDGHRSFAFTYTSPRDGKRARVTIGTYPSTSLAAARGRAEEARGYVQAGDDPRTVLAGQATAGMTVCGLIDVYLEDPEKQQLRTHAELKRRLKKHVEPVIGAVKLRELRRRDLRKVTDPILRRRCKAEANRAFEDVRTLVRWAVQNEYMDANPFDGMIKPAEMTARDRVLSDDEVETLWCGLPKALTRSEQCQDIIKLCLVTAQRVGEVAGLHTAELDLKAAEWRLPGARTKNGHAHIVPLSELAISIIKPLVPAGGGFLFPCGGETSLSAIAVARTILRANETSQDRPLGRFGIASWSAHDLRRTALTGMARLGVAPIVLGHVANHRSTTRAGVTMAVYAQYAYDREKREALRLWAERLESIASGGAKVIPIRASR
ncbi:MAG TPA: integrase arm-type DNA-binding domain-containing protein [Pseudolabrys sp.]|nr:integrase arm-type DNA-binding domain-containing protein [Pseudolabrys sp.]